MSRNLIILTLLFIVLDSCQNNRDRIKGSWIEQDNFANPTILEFEDFSFKIKTNNHNGEKLYHIQKDTFYFNDLYQIYKSIIKIENGKLEFYDFDSITTTDIFERNTYNDIVDYFNSKKKASIKLPKIEIGFRSTENNYQNSVFADYINNDLVFFFNGKLHVLNDTSYLTLINDNLRTKCQLFIDKDLTVSSLNKIKTELRKAQLNTVGYAVYDLNDSIINIGFLLPQIEITRGMPFPPFLKNNRTKNICVEVYKDSILVDGEITEKENLKIELIKFISSNEYGNINVYYNDSLKYDMYIKYLAEIQSAYIELRNEFALSKFQKSDYNDLESEQFWEVRNKYSMRIFEINKEEINKYAL